MAIRAFPCGPSYLDRFSALSPSARMVNGPRTTHSRRPGSFLSSTAAAPSDDVLANNRHGEPDDGSANDDIGAAVGDECGHEGGVRPSTRRVAGHVRVLETTGAARDRRT